jgi:hypothetical protein
MGHIQSPEAIAIACRMQKMFTLCCAGLITVKNIKFWEKCTGHKMRISSSSIIFYSYIFRSDKYLVGYTQKCM